MSGLEMKYFVLSPTKGDDFGKASRQAMLKFAEEIKTTNKDLAKDLTDWVKSIELNLNTEL